MRWKNSFDMEIKLCIVTRHLCVGTWPVQDWRGQGGSEKMVGMQGIGCVGSVSSFIQRTWLYRLGKLFVCHKKGCSITHQEHTSFIKYCDAKKQMNVLIMCFAAVPLLAIAIVRSGVQQCLDL